MKAQVPEEHLQLIGNLERLKVLVSTDGQYTGTSYEYDGPESLIAYANQSIAAVIDKESKVALRISALQLGLFGIGSACVAIGLVLSKLL